MQDGSKVRCEPADALTDGRLVSPSAERNKGPIAEILAQVLPPEGEVLEVSSGTGQHVAHFAEAMPHLAWQPTEREPELLASIEGWVAQTSPQNVKAPRLLDVEDTVWPARGVAAVVCNNMIHIAPPSATEGLINGAARVLIPGGILFLYGPFRRDGRHTAPSNEAFDAQLKARDPRWGVRDLEDVAALAGRAGFVLEATHDMPANNLAVVFRKG